MSLYEMAAHARICGNGAFEIDFGIKLERADICATKGLRCTAYGKTIAREAGHGETYAVYGDAVAESAISEDGGSVADGERCTILTVEFDVGDN